MPVKIRLMRIGAKKRPFYRVVAIDARKKRSGAYLEIIGHYNPLTHPHDIVLKKDRIDYWLKNGAVPSDGFLRITGKAPPKPSRLPKKQKKPKEETESKVKPDKVQGPQQLESESSNDQAPSTNETPNTNDQSI